MGQTSVPSNWKRVLAYQAGPAKDGKVVVGRFQKLAFAIRNFLEKGSLSIDMR